MLIDEKTAGSIFDGIVSVSPTEDQVFLKEWRQEMDRRVVHAVVQESTYIMMLIKSLKEEEDADLFLNDKFMGLKLLSTQHRDVRRVFRAISEADLSFSDTDPLMNRNMASVVQCRLDRLIGMLNN